MWWVSRANGFPPLILIPWQRETRLHDYVGLSKACFWQELPCFIFLLIIAENNLFLVKRLIRRVEMRNPDTASRRYTSLAWAAVLGHEILFEFLLTAGHDDEELSKVRPLFFPTLLSVYKQGFTRIQRTTPFLCCCPT
jgi:ankyrin repeat protein